MQPICAMCDGEQYKHLVIQTHKYWRIELRCEQVFLGSTFVILNRHLEDLTDITRGERKELFTILKQARNAIKKAFQPDKFNYASLGNISSHLHVQIIPRYANSVSFFDTTFDDKQWGKHLILRDKSINISDETLEKICKKIKETYATNLLHY